MKRSVCVVTKWFNVFLLQTLKVSDHYPVEVELKSLSYVEGNLPVHCVWPIRLLIMKKEKAKQKQEAPERLFTAKTESLLGGKVDFYLKTRNLFDGILAAEGCSVANDFRWIPTPLLTLNLYP